MLSDDGKHITCDHPDGCKETIKSHRWAKTSEWFFMKNGNAYCKDHHPDWVKTWRLSKELKNDA